MHQRDSLLDSNIDVRGSSRGRALQVSERRRSVAEEKQSSSRLSRLFFQFQMIVGRGGFGKVWLVNFKFLNRMYALKEMNKAKIVAKNSVHSVMNEKSILSSLSHPFLVNIKCSFQDRQNLYLLMDLVGGGDLRFHMCTMGSFSEEQTKFMAACVILGLEYVHSQGFLHRDIKPENLVFDERGYLHITDFGISRKWCPDNAEDTSGTPVYMSPEVIFHMPHSFETDYYALGVICYESIMGKRPYKGTSRKEIREQLLTRQIKLNSADISPEGIDFVNKLLQRKAKKRLGFEGIAELMLHPWFRGFDWKALAAKTMHPPFQPNMCDVKEYLHSIADEPLAESVVIELSEEDATSLFKDYAYRDNPRIVQLLEREAKIISISELPHREDSKVKNVQNNSIKSTRRAPKASQPKSQAKGNKSGVSVELMKGVQNSVNLRCFPSQKENAVSNLRKSVDRFENSKVVLSRQRGTSNTSLTRLKDQKSMTVRRSMFNFLNVK